MGTRGIKSQERDYPDAWCSGFRLEMRDDASKDAKALHQQGPLAIPYALEGSNHRSRYLAASGKAEASSE